MSSKHYCDICGKEMEKIIFKRLNEPNQLFELVGIEDCCDDCFDILHKQDISYVIKLAFKNICIPKTETQLEKDFMHWFATLSWVEQQRIYDNLKTIFKLIDKPLYI